MINQSSSRKSGWTNGGAVSNGRLFIMQNEWKVSVSFEVYIELDGFDGEEITERDIQNAFGSVDPVSTGGVKYFIKNHLDPEDIYRAGSVQLSKIDWVKEA